MRAPNRLLVVQRDAASPPGLLAAWAQRAGLSVTTVRAGEGEPLPAKVAPYAGVALVGSDAASRGDAVPQARDELSLAERALAERALTSAVPFLGICAGAQVLARALGGGVYRLDEPEIGWVRVASQRPALAGGPWLAWRREAFELPPQACPLAANETSLQAFACGAHVGVQFHPEATRPVAGAWLAAADPPPGPAVTRHVLGDVDGTWRLAAANAAALFSAWLGGALTHTAEPGAAG